jgi:SPP1 family predicted phage head-tail adaptor
MQSAQLDRKITLQRKNWSQDPYGAPVETWVVLASVWSAKRDISDGERVAAAEVSASITTRFVIRYDSSWADLNPKDRIAFDGRVYDIWGVKEIGRREGFEITAAARDDLEDDAGDGGPALIFSIPGNSQYIGQVV